MDIEPPQITIKNQAGQLLNIKQISVKCSDSEENIRVSSDALCRNELRMKEQLKADAKKR